MISNKITSIVELIPGFFSYPSRIDCKWGILSATFTLFVSTLWYLIHGYFERGLFYVIPIIILTYIAYIVIKYGKNVIFLFRFGLIWILIFGASVAWSFNAEIYAAPFGAEYQTHSATSALVYSGLLALSGIMLAWFTYFRKDIIKKTVFAKSIVNNGNNGNIRVINKISVIFLYAFAAVFIYRSGGIVTSTNIYHFDSNKLLFEFGILNIVIFFFSGLYLVTAKYLNGKNTIILSVISIPYIFAVLTGSRADYLLQIAVITLVLLTGDDIKNSSKKSIVLLMSSAITLYIVSSFIGVWRLIGSFDEAVTLFQNTFSLIRFRGDIELLSLSTGNQMLGGFYAVYTRVEINGESYLFGKSYFDYILRTPPAFLGFDRPQDLAWDMNIDGYLMQQGGIFELTEAYWNFGFIGVFMIPYLITYFLAFVLRKAVISKSYNIFYCTSFITLGLHAPRAIWYQTFGYWRAITFLIIVYLIFKVLKINR